MVYRAIHVAVSMLVATTRSRQIPTQVQTFERLPLIRCWDETWDSLEDVNHPLVMVLWKYMKIIASKMETKLFASRFTRVAWLMYWPLHVSEFMLYIFVDFEF